MKANGIIDSKKMLLNSAEIFSLPIFDANHYHTLHLSEFINPELARRYRVVPLAKENSTLHLGIADPTDQATLDAILFHTGLRIHPVLMTEDKLSELIENYSKLSTHPHLELNILNELPLDDEPLAVKENTVNYEEPLIKFVDNIIQHALQKNASDIHIEPYENYCRIRYRQDGILYQVAEIPHNFANRLVTRLKIMARLDISERRLPQDGRFQLNQNSSQVIDIRINTCPTVSGEKVALRILDANKVSLAINSLGLTDAQEKIFREKISQPQGMILVTGPTGSGKTVTLYSALRHLNTAEKNISTVEDPVEIQLPGINQVNIHPKIGLHFATVLRTFLRQDPDVLMVGEIRDTETAEIAIQAAETGHLVLSTLHTNSAIETLTRLHAMGIAPHHFSNSISLIISQRLARKLCHHCKQPDAINSEYFTAYKARGCEHCLYGYYGRIGIYEFLPVTTSLIQYFITNTPKETLYKKLKFQTLRQAGLEKIKQGITSFTEIKRIISE